MYQLRYLFVVLFSSTSLVASAQEYSPTTQEVCYATISYLNELVVANFDNYIINDIETMLRHADTKTIVSNSPFPGAKATIIEDTNSVNNYRSAKVIFMEKKLTDDKITEEMLSIYSNMISILYECLRGNGFEIISNHNDAIKRVKYETLFKSAMPSDYNTLTTTNTLSLALRLNSFKGPSDVLYTHQITLSFVRN